MSASSHTSNPPATIAHSRSEEARLNASAPPRRPPPSEPAWQPRWELPWREPLSATSLALAEDYERRTTLFPGWRERLVTLLELHPGDTIIDVACGPGLNFEALHAAVGPRGTIIGIEESPELLAVAAEQVTRRRWDNIELINAPAQAADLTVPADAALFTTAHDVVTSPAALTNILTHLRAGATVAAGGWKWPSRWLWPLRGLVTALNRPDVTNFTGFDRPWQVLAKHVSQMQLSEVGFGTGYLARAYTPTPPGAAAAPCIASPSIASPDGDRGPSKAMGSGGRFGWFLNQVSAVLDPLVELCAGQPTAIVRQSLAHSWQAEFGVRLPEPALTDCATALSHGRPWIPTLWTGGW